MLGAVLNSVRPKVSNLIPALNRPEGPTERVFGCNFSPRRFKSDFLSAICCVAARAH